MSSLLVTAVDFYRVISAANQPAMKSIVITMSNTFGLIEIIIFSRFILFNLSSVLRQRIVKISVWLYFGVMLVNCIRDYCFIFSTAYYLVPTIFLIPLCLVYFYELLATANPKRLRDRPGFWIITGAFLVSSGTAPLMMCAKYLGSYYDVAYSLNYFLFGILFILLTRAYLCPSDEAELKEMGRPYSVNKNN